MEFQVNKKDSIPKRFYVIRILLFLIGDYKKNILWMFLFMFIQSLISLIGLGLIVPLGSLVLNISYFDVSQDISSFSALQQFIITTSRDVYAYLHLSSPIQLVILLGAVFVCFYFVRLLLGLFLEYRINIFAYSAQNYVYKKFFLSYLTMPYVQFLGKNVSLYTHVLGLTQEISSTLRAVLLICNDAIFLCFIGISLFIWSPVLMGGILGIIVLGMVVNAFIKKYITRASGVLEKSLLAKNRVVFRGFFQFMFNKLYHLEKYLIRNIDGIQNNIMKSTSMLEVYKTLYKVIIEFITVVVVVVYLSYIASDSALVKEAITTFILLAAALVRIVPAWIRILGYLASVRAQEVNFTVIYNEYVHIMEHEEKEEVHADTYEPFSFNESIEVHKVHYSYPVQSQNVQEQKDKSEHTVKQSKVLRGICLTIHKGERIGFVGESGGGKTTLCNIIMGFLCPQKGNIFVDGKNIFDNKRGWQKHIGYVPQESLLSDDSIVNNIAYGEEPDTIDRKKVEMILKKLLLWGTVQGLPQGIDTPIGDFGKNLSGGQKQRMSIARALYRDPSVLVFDEATSNLDTKTEKEVQSAIDRIGRDKTIIIIAHRVNTLSKCDRIYSLSKGNVEFEGNYTQLLSFQK